MLGSQFKGGRGLRTTKISNPSIMAEKATKRVIAPFVKIVRKGFKPVIRKHSYELSTLLQRAPTIILQNFDDFIGDTIELGPLLHDTADILKQIVHASDVRIYILDPAANTIYLSDRAPQSNKITWPINEPRIVAAYVAKKKEYLLIPDIILDDRFPDGIGYQDELVKAVLCIPIVYPDGECFGVIEFSKRFTESRFKPSDLEITIVVAGWIGAAIHQNRQRLALQKQTELNEYLLQLVRCFFSERTVSEELISRTSKLIKATLNAQHCTLFFLDQMHPESKQATVYEEGVGENNEDAMFRKALKKKLALDRGLIGLAVKNGSIINIRDAKKDSRFLSEYDDKPHVITKSVLCAPIKGVTGTDILGIVHLINKVDSSTFTEIDERLIAMISNYLSLTLYYTRNVNLSEKKTDQIIIYKELLQRAMQPCQHEHKQMMENLKVDIPPDFDSCLFNVTPDKFYMIPHYLVYIFTTILPLSILNLEQLTAFFLCVIKFYRNNTYHNIEHGFLACHSMYLILKRNANRFTLLEKKALLVSSLCHDVDHLGRTNNFLKLMNHTLAHLYEESILEHHHFNVTQLMLETFDIFDNPVDKDLLYEIKNAVIATDLALYFKAKAKLMQILEENFDWDSVQHRNLLKSIAITSCDLGAQFKPFPVTKRIIDNLYQEFYDEGDKEKEIGLCPISIMDRDKKHTVPEDQVQFLTVVAIPCFDILRKVLPNVDDFLEEAINNRQKWLEVVQTRGTKCWRQQDSVVEK